MKQPINEIKRMQQLAGIINESQLEELSLTRREEEALATWKKTKDQGGYGNNIVGNYAFHEIEPDKGWSKYELGDVAIYKKHTATDQAELIGYFKNGEGEMLPPIK